MVERIRRDRGWISWALAATLLVHAQACTSAEERCGEAVTEASKAWKAYAGVLEAGIATRKKAVAERKLQLEGEIDQRLAHMAKTEATRRHHEGTMEWHRAYAAHYKAACTQDEECAAVRVAQSEAEAELETLSAALKASSAVLTAADGNPAAFIAAIAEVPEDFDHPEYKAAQAASKAAGAACSDL